MATTLMKSQPWTWVSSSCSPGRPEDLDEKILILTFLVSALTSLKKFSEENNFEHVLMMPCDVLFHPFCLLCDNFGFRVDLVTLLAIV